MLILILKIIFGFGLLLVGGEVLVRGSVAVAKAMGLSSLVIGLTVVAFGTSSPELVVSVQSSLAGYPDIALGNVIGSNISNIMLVLGATALIYPIAAEKGLAEFDGILMLLFTVVMVIFCITGKELVLWEGIVMFLLLVVYIILAFKKAYKEKWQTPDHQVSEVEEQIDVELKLWHAIAFVVVGIGLLVFGADTLVTGAVGVAEFFEIPQSVIGVTVVAIGSSAPELATCAVAAWRKHSDIAIGNVVGSNIFNIAGIMGITALISPVTVNPNYLRVDLWILVAVSVILWLLMKFGRRVSRVSGGLFLAGYIGYVAYQYVAVS
ncbi:MAG: calcium/sodium antiporter [Rickettsiales bacterium]|nr:calcium/sodium antiporter [Rickettsiales bacterium]